MSRLPSFTDLVDWVDGRLDHPAAARVQALVDAGVHEVTESVAWIREFRRAARSLPLLRPPAELSSNLRQLFRDHHRVGGSAWIEAATRFDSRSQPMVGVRSAATLDLAHLVFDGDFGALVLDVDRVRQGHVDLRGYLSLLDGPDDGARVSVHRGGSALRIAQCDGNGRFELSDVPSDVDEIWIVQGDTCVRVQLDVRAG